MEVFPNTSTHMNTHSIHKSKKQLTVVSLLLFPPHFIPSGVFTAQQALSELVELPPFPFLSAQRSESSPAGKERGEATGKRERVAQEHPAMHRSSNTFTPAGSWSWGSLRYPGAQRNRARAVTQPVPCLYSGSKSILSHCGQ